MGIVGVLAGAALGLTMHRLLPGVLQNFIPFPLPRAIAWTPVLGGMVVGLAVCILFALPPLLRFRRVSPLLALRASVDENAAPVRRDLATWLVYLFIAASLTAFAILQAETWTDGLFVAGGLALAIAILVGVAKLLIFLVRKLLPQSWSFVLRQGLANLHRPNNRTLLLTLSLGLGTFLLLTIYLTRDVLLTQFRSIDANNQPNIFLFDIQPDQTKAVADLVRQEQLPVIQEAPIVTMRLTEVKGRKSSDILKDPQQKVPEWELEREYRSTYRPDLSETEKITAGKWVGHFDYHPGDTVPISVEQDIAKDLGLTIGDTMVFDVQGVPIKTRVASLREVDWKRFQTNFFIVFPTGVLENAPTFNVLVSRVPTPAASARLQNAVVAKFPNVSALDLTSVHSNGRFDPEQGRARHSHHVALHRRHRFDRGREHDLERALSAAEGKRAPAHAGRVALADLEDSRRRILVSRPARERDRDRACARRELGAGRFHFQARLHAIVPAGGAGGADCQLVNGRWSDC